MRWLRIRRGPAMSSGSFGFFPVLYSFCGWYRVLGDKAAVGLRAEIYWGFARLVPGVFRGCLRSSVPSAGKSAVGLRAEFCWGFARLVPGVFWLSLDPFLLYGVEGRT